MKIAIIGNSHVAALKMAWDQMEVPGIEVTFFAHRGVRLTGIKVDGNALVPATDAGREAIKFTSGGLERIVPDDFDQLLLYGLGTRAYIGYETKGISSQAKHVAVRDCARLSISYEMLMKLRQITDRKIYIGHNPMAAADSVDNRSTPHYYLSGLKYINAEVYAPLNAELIGQPVSTIVNKRFTDPIFTKDSMRLDIGDELGGLAHPTHDFTHMNAEFGRLWLTEFFEKLR